MTLSSNQPQPETWQKPTKQPQQSAGAVGGDARSQEALTEIPTL